MSKPRNEAFDKPPALATRSSVKDIYVSPELTSTSNRASSSSAAVSVASTATATARSASTPALDEVFEDSSASVRPVVTTTAFAAGTITVTTPSITLPVVTTAVTTVITSTTTATNMDVAGPSAAADAVPAPTPSVVTAPVVRGGDSCYAPPTFHGTGHEDAQGWLSQFEKYATYRNLSDDGKKNFMAVILRDEASDWFDTLPATATATWAALKTAFQQRFQDTDLLRWQKASSMWQRVQGKHESVDAFVSAMRKMAKAVSTDDVQLRFAIQRGLRPELIAHVIQSQPTSIDELIRVARLAEAAAAATAAASTDVSWDRMINELAANRNASERNTEEIRRLAQQLTVGPGINAVGNTSTAPTAAGHSAAVTEARRTNAPRWRDNTAPRGRAQGAAPSGRTQGSACTYCGGSHMSGKQYCRAADVCCWNCNKVGHLRRMCRSARRPRQDGGDGQNFSAYPQFHQFPHA